MWTRTKTYTIKTKKLVSVPPSYKLCLEINTCVSNIRIWGPVRALAGNLGTEPVCLLTVIGACAIVSNVEACHRMQEV